MFWVLEIGWNVKWQPAPSIRLNSWAVQDPSERQVWDQLAERTIWILVDQVSYATIGVIAWADYPRATNAFNPTDRFLKSQAKSIRDAIKRNGVRTYWALEDQFRKLRFRTGIEYWEQQNNDFKTYLRKSNECLRK